MSEAVAQVSFWLMAALAVAGALVTVFGREIMRMALGLATFLLAAAGLFLYYGAGFLAAAQVFVYVGGVLVVLVLAIMVLRRGGSGVPDLSSRHDVFTGVICALVAVGGSSAVLGRLPAGPAAATPAAGGMAGVLLGGMLTQFELLGALLLVALVAVVAVSGGERG